MLIRHTNQHAFTRYCEGYVVYTQNARHTMTADERSARIPATEVCLLAGCQLWRLRGCNGYLAVSY